MEAAAALLIFMLLLCMGDYSQAQEHKTVLIVSFNQLNSTGLRANESTYLVSPDGTFCAGFYDVTAKGYALAVWYANDSSRTLAWMANSSSLVGVNSSLVLRNGNLSILDDKGQIAWERNVQRADPGRSMDLILRDSGNLVLNTTEARTGDLWQSFTQFPTFTLLPYQNFSSKDNLMSRVDDGTYGKDNFYGLSLSNSMLSLYYGKEADRYYWQSAGIFPTVTLDNHGFLNTSAIGQNGLIMASDRGEGPLRRLTLDTDGNLRMYSRNPPSSSWNIVWEAVPEHCKIYGTCGDNALCKVDENWNPSCECPPGFKLNSSDNRSCVTLNETEYRTNSIFIALDYVYFDGPNTTNLQALTIDDCIHNCAKNSNCLGFAHTLDDDHCVFQYDRLLNGYWSPEKHSIMYVKAPASAIAAPNLYNGTFSVVDNVCRSLLALPFPPKDSDHKKRDLAIICTLFVAELLCGVLAFWAFLRKYSKFSDIARIFALNLFPSGSPKKFTYAELKLATNNFRDVLGRGGFGPVYRGLLPDQRQIAVKKLEGLHQGEQQFWAEVTIIGRIHHLNLVRMWGFCSEGENKLLVYEFIPNGSLDRHLFNRDGPNILEWGVRYRIALGVARAIAYLHEECLEWVLHCDIKPENILLDENFCPKVSDFGLAKLVEKERSLKMSTIRGTRGYLAPECYGVNPITAKADVYSFGMVLLEMVSGKRNFALLDCLVAEGEEWYFPAVAFQKVVVERRVVDVVDERLRGVRENRSQMEAVERMVKTALWCIQRQPGERPSMGRVAKMLEGTVEIEDPPMSSSFMDLESDAALAYSGTMSIKSSALSRF